MNTKVEELTEDMVFLVQGCNPEYVAMAERRIADMVGPLFEVTP